VSKVVFTYGAMNSGKTTALMSVAYNYGEMNSLGRPNGNALVLKPSADTKGDRQLVNRRGERLDVDILATPDMDVFEEVHAHMARVGMKDLACLLVDEAQFSTEKQVWQMLQLAKMSKIAVLAYGIRTDFQGKLFPGSKALFEVADEFVELSTICRCQKKARFNGRMDNGVFVFEGNQVAIDGVDNTTYEPLCGTCYLEEQAKAIAV